MSKVASILVLDITIQNNKTNVNWKIEKNKEIFFISLTFKIVSFKVKEKKSKTNNHVIKEKNNK
jgi:hypothetical protein